MTDKQTDKVKVETKRIRGRNLHDTITQVLELVNTSGGWAVTKATMLGMGADVYLERSEKQAVTTEDKPNKTTKVEADVKAKEEVVEADKPSEKSDEVAVVEEADSGTADKPKQTRSTRSRNKK